MALLVITRKNVITQADIYANVSGRAVSSPGAAPGGGTGGGGTGSGAVIDDASVSTDFTWSSSRIKGYTDGSLALRDASIAWLNLNKSSSDHTHTLIGGQILDVSIVNPNTLQVLRYSAGYWKNFDIDLSGEANTASNVGIGIPLHTQKIGVDLRFRSILSAGDISIGLSSDVSTLIIDFDRTYLDGSLNARIKGPGTSVDNRFALWDGSTGNSLKQSSFTDASIILNLSNFGLGVGELFRGISAQTAQLKTLKAGPNISLTNGSDEVTITGTTPPGTNLFVFNVFGGAAANATLSSQPEAQTDFTGNERTRFMVDLSTYTEYKAFMNVITGSTSANNPRVYLQYSTDNISWFDNDSSTGSAAMGLTTTGWKNSGWTALANPNARNDNQLLRFAMAGGDGSSSPVVTRLHVIFR